MNIIYKPVFIFSLHRSGSTYLKNIIDVSSEIRMLEDEVHFDHPFFFNTFKKYYKKYCKNNPYSYDKFLGVITEKKIRGAFWDQYKNKYGNFSYSKKYLAQKSECNVWEAFNSILKHVRHDSGKSRIGIKYPAHHKFYHIFEKEYPDAKNIFLVRDPRAIIASKLISPTNYRLQNKNSLQYEFVRLLIILYFISEFRSFAKTITNNKNNSYLLKYESLVTNRDEQLESLCDFVEIELKPAMQTANGKDSGYGDKPNPIDRTKRWVTVLRNYEKAMISFLTQKSRHVLGYE
jgi:hypothetical protein